MQSLTSRVATLLACASLTATLAATAVQADELHVTAASASTNALYEISFGPTPPVGATALAATPIPPQGNSSVRSLAYISNEQTGKVDLLVADTTGGKIVRYAAAAGPALPVWAWPVAGPRGTDGLSVDSQGNLYALSSDSARNELWVLRRNPALPAGAGLLPPLLVDNSNFATTSKTRLLETVVVRTAIPGGPGTGDLLVLINDGRVLRYAAASLQNFLAGARPIAPPQTLITAAQSLTAHKATGMALWPTDGSLLVATIGGSVLRYTLTTTGSTAMPAFATGLGLSLGRIKTFVRSNVPYAVFDQPLRSKIFEFGAPPTGGCPNLAVACNTALATVTTVSNPVGLATTDSSAPSQDCVFTDNNPDNGCTLLGGAVKLGVSSAAEGATILDVSCTIDQDPRVNPTTGFCDNSRLTVADYCPGYGPTVIPGYLCGASGPSMRGFALIKSVEQNGFLTAPKDLLVKQELSADALLAPPNPACPQLTVGWAPLTGEGTIPEVDDMIELTSYCGSGRGLTPGHSLIGVGLQLNPNFFAGATIDDKLVAFANQKLQNLNLTIGSAAITEPAKTDLSSCVAKIGTYLINSNGNLPDPSQRNACAAHQAWTCDNSLNANNFGSNSDKLSAYSAIRGRLANLVTHINNRIAHLPAPKVWPLPDPALGSPATLTDPAIPPNPLPAAGCDPDITPPSAPVFDNNNLSSTLTTVTLNWQPSTDASGIGGYRLTRTGPVASAPVTLAPNVYCTLTNCSYTDSGLNVETTYSYELVAFDMATLGANYSTPPTTTSAKTLDDTLPPNPAPYLSWSDKQTDSVTLSWTASTDPIPGTGFGGYKVYRGTSLIYTAPEGTTTFQDTGLTPATAYSYQVVAFDLSKSNGGGPNIAPSQIVTVTTLNPPDETPPTTPTGLTKTYTGTRSLTLSWTASTDTGTGVGGYYVYLNGGATPVGSTTGTTFLITISSTVTSSDTKFSYQVAAYDKAPVPGPNVSPKSSPPLIVSCYDPGRDHDCDRFP